MTGWLERAIPDQSPAYRRLVVRAYLAVPRCIVAEAPHHLARGLFHAVRRDRERRIEEFLRGAALWGERVRRMTETTVLRLDDIDCPPRGHLILANHVNELDVAFDCLVLRRPYLANAAIKQTVFAYWWMRAMGSEVFDHRNPRTIPQSVRALLRGLERQSYVVYPEGANSYGEEIRPLRKGMLKLAFEHHIPVYAVLKSGMAAFQQRQRGNTVGYRALGTIDPTSFPSWTAFRDHVHARMAEAKPRLDEEVRRRTVS